MAQEQGITERWGHRRLEITTGRLRVCLTQRYHQMMEHLLCALHYAFACYLWASIMPRDVSSAFEIRKLESREFGAIPPDYINATSSAVLKALDKKS